MKNYTHVFVYKILEIFKYLYFWIWASTIEWHKDKVIKILLVIKQIENLKIHHWKLSKIDCFLNFTRYFLRTLNTTTDLYWHFFLSISIYSTLKRSSIACRFNPRYPTYETLFVSFNHNLCKKKYRKTWNDADFLVCLVLKICHTETDHNVVLSFLLSVNHFVGFDRL